MVQYPTYQSILVFDVEGFGDAHRNASDQLAVRAAFYRVLEDATTAVRVPLTACTCEDRGDGAIVLVPPEVSKVVLLDPLLPSLSAALAEHNRTVPLPQRFRLRVALHAGEVSRDNRGLSGADLVMACRMLDATELKTALRNTVGSLALIISEHIYYGIVRHRYGRIDPASYHAAIVQVKKDRIKSWIHLPGVSEAPVIATEKVSRLFNSPSQLMPAVSSFVNRERELNAMSRAAAEFADSAGRRLIVLVGPPGVGKTALGLYWAHRVRGEYQDGQLYADFGGPLGPVGLAPILERFLVALGTPPQQVPADVFDQAVLFRALTADLRLLIFLDDATSSADVRALLPVSGRSMTVVTGRSRLGSLAADRALFVELTPLTSRHGVELLSRTVGEPRIAAEVDRAEQLVSLCGGLPIALNVVGARLATRPRWTIEQVLTDLLDERRRLIRLSFNDDLSVQAVFDVSYQALSAPAARLYRLLGLHPGPEFDAGVAAAVLRSPLLETEGLIDELLNANLLNELQAGRYRFHELLRLHAVQRAHAEEPAEARALAARRMLDWYLYTATLAGQVITPHRTNLRRDVEYIPLEPRSFASYTDALDWLDRERVNLLAAARQASESGSPATAWQLADAMWGLFLYRTHYQEWLQFDLVAERAARDCGDQAMEAESEDRLGLLFHALGRNDEALKHMARAADLWRQLSNPLRVASSLERFGFVYLDQGNVELAIVHFTQALDGYRRAGEQRNVGLALISLGRALNAIERYDDAGDSLRQAVQELDSLPVADPYNNARAQLALARSETRVGQVDSALRRLESALDLMRSVHSPLGQADVWWAMAELHEQARHLGAARDAYERAAVLLTEVGNPGAARVRERLEALGPSHDPS